MSRRVKRLYEQFQPENYQLHLKPNRDAMTFSGTVTIRGKKMGRPAQRLTFHQKGLKITDARIVRTDRKGDQKIAIDRINLQASYDEVRLHTKDKFFPGTYTVILEFEGKITRPMQGIYPCYFKHDGKEKMLIATQFESHHAREAFPCIDEPEAKATFDLALTTPKGETVLANTPARSQLKEGDNITSIFETTPRMSTYLLAFAYGEMDYLEAKTKDGVKVRTYATPANAAHTKFALDTAVKALDFYNDYFDIPYPLAKCDFVALPDFASGAMENWGLITFREAALLVDPKNTSLHAQQFVANVVAHELTHQWFGNLVTMRWWTDLWLNESFASWMSYLAVDKIYPKWKVWTQFIIDEQGLALKQDSLENTHPIEVEVRHPDEIRTIFDVISYEKGASVLLMLQNYLGANNFRDGLRLYLKRHAYANTDTVDLWAALEEVSAKPVKEFMGTWTAQAGYPIVKVDIGGKELKLGQERFYINPAAKKEESVWPIPLLSSQPLQQDTLSKSKLSLTPGKLLGSFHLNQDRTSFFRSIYNAEHLASLAKAVKSGKLNELDRLGLLSDSFEAAKAGYSSSVDSLKLLTAYQDEDSSVVWDVIAGNIGGIRTVMDNDEVRDNLKPFLRELTAKQLKRLGWEEKSSDSHFDRLLRPTILGLASLGEEQAVVAEAKARFAAMQAPEDLHPDLRSVVYGTIARRGGAADFDKMLAMHNSTSSSEEKVTLAAALTGFEQPILIKEALAQIISDDVKLQDAMYWIAYSFMNRHARSITWKWMMANWSWLENNLGQDLSFYRLPNYAGRGFSDVNFLLEFKEFFDRHMSPAFERPVKQAIETIQWQAAWKKRDLKKIIGFLKKQ